MSICVLRDGARGQFNKRKVILVARCGLRGPGCLCVDAEMRIIWTTLTRGGHLGILQVTVPPFFSKVHLIFSASKYDPLELYCVLLVVVRVRYVFFFSYPRKHVWKCATARIVVGEGSGAVVADGNASFCLALFNPPPPNNSRFLNRHKKQLRDQGLSAERAGEE